MDVPGEDSKFVEHIAPLLYGLVAGIVLAQLGHGLGIAWLRLDIFTLLEIYVSKGKLRERLVDTVARGFLGGEDIVFLGLGGVFAA